MEITEQHKTLLSMYYHGELEPGRVFDPIVTYDLDLIELLLLMEAVFKVSHYELSIGNSGGTAIVQSPQYNAYYKDLVSPEKILNEHNVLGKTYLKGFDVNDYKRIMSEGTHCRKDLFHYDVVTTCINCLRTLDNRKQFMHYLLYDIDGKKLIIYLKNRLTELVNRICYPVQTKLPVELVNSIIEDYKDFMQLYGETGRQLTKFFSRSNSVNESFGDDFINEHYEMNSWIEKCSKTLGKGNVQILDYLYNDNLSYRSIALEIIYQFCFIVDLYSLGNLSTSWLQCINNYDHQNDSPLEMSKLNELLDRLAASRTSGQSGAKLKMDQWRDEYITSLNSALDSCGIS